MKRFVFSQLLFLLLASGCYLPTSGRVIDAETNEPVEGALVFVQWSVQHGLGLTYHTVHKMAETVTDKQGRFSLPGAYNPFVDEPVMVIYKYGYIAWRNDSVLSMKKDESGKLEVSVVNKSESELWKHGSVNMLERFKEGYSHGQNYYFLHNGIADVTSENAPKYQAAASHELSLTLQEVKDKRDNDHGRPR